MKCWKWLVFIIVWSNNNVLQNSTSPILKWWRKTSTRSLVWFCFHLLQYLGFLLINMIFWFICLWMEFMYTQDIHIYIINTCIQNHTNHLSNKSDSSSKWPWPWPWSWCPLLTSASPHVVAQVPSQSGPVAVVLPPTPTAWGELVVGAENPLAVVFSTKNFGRFRNTYASCSKDYWKELEDFEQQDGEARKSRVVQVH